MKVTDLPKDLLKIIDEYVIKCDFCNRQIPGDCARPYGIVEVIQTHYNRPIYICYNYCRLNCAQSDNEDLKRWH